LQPANGVSPGWRASKARITGQVNVPERAAAADIALGNDCSLA
jgi:hypothetical protein